MDWTISRSPRPGSRISNASSNRSTISLRRSGKRYSAKLWSATGFRPREDCRRLVQPAFEQQRRLGPAYNLGSTSTLCGRGDRLPRFPSLKTAFIGLTHKRKHITQDKPEGRVFCIDNGFNGGPWRGWIANNVLRQYIGGSVDERSEIGWA